MDLSRAVSHTAVDLLILGLGGFVLETTLKSIEGIGSDTRDSDGDLGNHEFGNDSSEASIFLPGVKGLKDILETELNTSVDNNTHGGWSNTIVE